MHICDMLTGYARVSTDDQDLRLRRTALKVAGRHRTFEERRPGRSATGPSSPGSSIRFATRAWWWAPGSIDWPARRGTSWIAERLKAAGASLRSLAESWADTTSRRAG